MCVEIRSISRTAVCFHIDNYVCRGTLRVLGVYRRYNSLSIRGGLDFVNVSLYHMDTVSFTHKDLGPQVLEPQMLLTVSKLGPQRLCNVKIWLLDTLL